MIQKIKSVLRSILPKSTFARGVSVLVGGTAGAQLIAILSAPLLTRLFTPKDFGLFAVFASVLAIISVVSSLRYELAIPLPKDDTEAANITALCLLLVFVTTSLCWVFTAIFATQIANTLGFPQMESYIWLIPLGTFFTGSYNVLNYWAVRTKNFGAVAGTRISQAVGMLTIQLSAYKLGGLALLIGQVVGQGIGIASLARSAWASPAFAQVTWTGVLHAALRYKRFPLFSTWEGLTNSAGVQMPPLMFVALFSPVAAGLYTLANRVLSLPMLLIGNAIGQVFFANAAQAHREGKLGPLVEKLHIKLAHIGLPPTLVLIMLGPEMFVLIFGEEWHQAGEFARWMAPWLYLVFVSSPLSTLFAVTETLKQGLGFQIILLISRVGVIALGAWMGDLLITIILFTVVSALCWLGFLFWVAHVAGNSLSSAFMPTLTASVFSILSVLPILVVKMSVQVSSNSWLYALIITTVIISMRYLQLLRDAYK